MQKPIVDSSDAPAQSFAQEVRPRFTNFEKSQAFEWLRTQALNDNGHAAAMVCEIADRRELLDALCGLMGLVELINHRLPDYDATLNHRYVEAARVVAKAKGQA